MLFTVCTFRLFTERVPKSHYSDVHSGLLG